MRTKRRVERTLRLQQQGKSTETVSSNHRLNPHLSVVVRLAGDRIGAAWDEHVGFRPVGLHVPNLTGAVWIIPFIAPVSERTVTRAPFSRPSRSASSGAMKIGCRLDRAEAGAAAGHAAKMAVLAQLRSAPLQVVAFRF